MISIILFRFRSKKIPGTPLSGDVVIKAKDAIFFFSHRRNDVRAGVVSEVSPCGTSFHVRVYEWPTITTKGQFFAPKKGTEIVGKAMVYSKLKMVKASSSLGSTFERASTQCKFPELHDIFKKRGATKSKKTRSIADAFKGQSSKKSKTDAPQKK